MSSNGTELLKLAVLAHEFRNPLAAIQCAVRVLQMREGPVKTQHEACTLIARQSSLLVRLVDDLFSVTRLAAGRLELRKQRVDIKSVVTMAVESCAPVIGAGSHQLQIRLPERGVSVDADPMRLTQVVVNLLENAAKYSAPCGQIVLSVEHDDGEATIRVQDDGIGIAPENLPAVFGLFVQVGSTLTGATYGMGIGLYLVKQIVELHEGRVEAYSAGLGYGSVFTVCLPKASWS